jgi:hypothetical protein
MFQTVERVTMPLLSRLLIRTALIWLAVGYTVGGLLLAQKGFPLAAWLWSLRYTHVHMLLVGWTIQLAAGVAFWILPRLDTSGSRGDERLVWWYYSALNAGVVLAALHDPLVALAGRDALVLRSMPMLAGLLYLVAAILFVRHAWPRIVAFRALARPDQI